MDTKSTSITGLHIRKKIELFFSYWKWICFSVIVALVIAFTHLRYTNYEYKANATIKIRDEKQSTMLPSMEEMGSNGLFSQGSDKIKDEISVIQSRTLFKNIVEKLKLNISYFEEGKIKEKELYSNPAIKVSFFQSDSIINEIKTNLFIKIKSPSEFILFKEQHKYLMNRVDSEGEVYSFGDKIETSYGGYVITPNIGKNKPKIGSNIRVSINRLNSVVGSYQRKVKVSTSKGSSIVKLELQETVAQKAIDILNQLILEYNNDVLADKEAVVNVTSDFINTRLAKVSEELNQVELTAEELQKNNRLTALGSQANIYLEREKNNESQILVTSNRLKLIDFLQEEISVEGKASDLLPLNVVDDSGVNLITKNYNELVYQRDKILKNSSEINPTVIKLNDQISQQESSLQNTLSNMKQSNNITLNTLNKEDVRIRGQIYSAPKRQRQFRDIERKQGMKESLYLYLLEKREETTIRLGMYSPNAKIIDSAYSSFRPVAPNPTITYLAAFIFGLALPIAVIYLIILTDTKIYRKNDLIDILDIPYIGDIPKTSKKETLIKKVDYSPKAEAFRIIRSNIDFMLKSTTDGSKKIFITSTKAQEGKSHTSTNLASSISFSEKSVLLIEMDIRVPKIMNYLGLKDESKIGLSDFIVDNKIKPQDIVIKHKENKYLDIIPSGTIPPNPSELLMSDRIKELFNYFEDKYDYIVVDTSAVGIVSDTLLIANFADMFIYVVGADNVDKRQLSDVAQTLYNEKRLPNMTLLLNGVKRGKGGYGYGYGYGNNPNKNTKNKWYSFS
ncbi:GumC family protein [Winogradskyella sp. UBA3174]|uniref:GumC family protein n=1 Tax=Winogradskyella sp. UBA3174 TaxID=1947785 RepID=UPI0025DE3BF4|nr:tyrosine-protein kinase family protein [Winogradskyella sp. UBA3174]|tara:strand:- start:34412 stop:36781 length:2370 start_codon:yes stop_codon:yes gene_type:complete